jgi:hypothetical protein
VSALFFCGGLYGSADNCQAGTGMLPDAALRKRIIAHWEAGK